MIRIGILALVIIMLGGCATSLTDLAASGSLHDIKETCRIERSKLIRAEWRDFEFRNWAIIGNDWDKNSSLWAKTECEYGRRIESYHPHYIKGSILRR